MAMMTRIHESADVVSIISQRNTYHRAFDKRTSSGLTHILVVFNAWQLGWKYVFLFSIRVNLKFNKNKSTLRLHFAGCILITWLVYGLCKKATGYSKHDRPGKWWTDTARMAPVSTEVQTTRKQVICNAKTYASQQNDCWQHLLANLLKQEWGPKNGGMGFICGRSVFVGVSHGCKESLSSSWKCAWLNQT